VPNVLVIKMSSSKLSGLCQTCQGCHECQSRTIFNYENINYTMTPKNKKTFLRIGENIIYGNKISMHDKKILLHVGASIRNKVITIMKLQIDKINNLKNQTKEDKNYKKLLISKLNIIKIDETIKSQVCIILDYAKKFASALYINEVD
jgi:hypothetical protein